MTATILRLIFWPFVSWPTRNDVPVHPQTDSHALRREEGGATHQSLLIVSAMEEGLLKELRRWPLDSFGPSQRAYAARISRELELSRAFDINRLESSAIWIEWSDLIDYLARIGSSAGFANAPFLANLAPYIHLHTEILAKVSYSRSFSFKIRPLMRELLSNFSSRYKSSELDDSYRTIRTNLPRLYQKQDVLDFSPALMRSLIEQIGRVELPHEKKSLFTLLESIVSLLALGSPDKHDQQRQFLCSKFTSFANFSSGVIKQRDLRRHDRFIASLINICKEIIHVDTRRLVIDILPRQSVWIEMPSDKIAMIEQSAMILEYPVGITDREESPLLQQNIKIELSGSIVQGFAGPRNLWLSTLIEHYFSPNNGIFIYSDPDSMQFLKPAANANSNRLIAVGRVIGLSLRYKVTIGARLTPCAVALLRLPSQNFNLEKSVFLEDPAFVNGLEQLRRLDISNVQLEESIKDIDQFIEDKLFEKGIASIYPQMRLISRGIHSVIPSHNFLEIFTDAEFEEAINGRKSLPPSLLWGGMVFASIRFDSSVENWLKEIIYEQDDSFRFALHKFVTGIIQPPINRERPWIHVEISEFYPRDKLPRSRTCCGTLILPNYSSKESLLDKLILAIFETNDSLELP